MSDNNVSGLEQGLDSVHKMTIDNEEKTETLFLVLSKVDISDANSLEDYIAALNVAKNQFLNSDFMKNLDVFPEEVRNLSKKFDELTQNIQALIALKNSVLTTDNAKAINRSLQEFFANNDETPFDSSALIKVLNPDLLKFTRSDKHVAILNNGDVFKAAVELLREYSKPSLRNLIWHPKRHHELAVREIVYNASGDNKTINTPEKLLEALYAIKLVNPVTGSLARRIALIEEKMITSGQVLSAVKEIKSTSSITPQTLSPLETKDEIEDEHEDTSENAHPLV
jgi:hypothetical protein